MELIALTADDGRGTETGSGRTDLTTDEVAHALDAAGWTRFSTKIFLIAGLGWMADGAESAVLSYMLPTLKQQWSLIETELGSIATLIAAGQALGALFWGLCADAVGRRPAFIMSVLLTAVLGIASAVAPDLRWYVGLRAATGFAIGGNLPLAISITTELLPPRCCDRALVALHLFYEVGALSSTGLALWLMPSSCAAGSRCAWRTYLLLVTIPALAVVPVTFVRLPESPVWLAAQGRSTEVWAVIAKANRGFELVSGTSEDIHGADTSDAVDGWKDIANDARGTNSDSDRLGTVSAADGALEVTQSTAQTKRKRIMALGRQLCLLRSTGLICAVWLCADMASGWWTWTPTFATMQGVDAQHAYIATLVARVVASCAFVIATLLIDHVGPRRLLVSTLAATTAVSALLTVWTNDSALFAADSFIFLYGIFALFFGGIWSIMYAVTPQVFPTFVRGAGVGLASAVGKIGTLTGPIVVGILSPSILDVGIFFTSMFAASTIALLLLCCYFPIRQRDAASAP